MELGSNSLELGEPIATSAREGRQPEDSVWNFLSFAAFKVTGLGRCAGDLRDGLMCLAKLLPPQLESLTLQGALARYAPNILKLIARRDKLVPALKRLDLG
jgi:hypothetical protein